MASNVLEYILRLRDEFSQAVRGIATGTGVALEGVSAKSQTMDRDLNAGFSRISQGLGVVKGDFSKLGDIVGGFGGPAALLAGAVVGALGGIITKTMEAAEGFRKLSEKTGATIGFLSGFTQAADDVFVSSDTVSLSLTIFAKKLGGVEDAADGSGISAGAFSKKLQEIGVNSDNIEESLLAVADKFAGMANGADKTALAVQLFGKQGAELIPILNKGASGIKDMMTEAKALGLVLGDEAVEGTTRLKQGLDKLNDRIEGIALRAGPSLIGVVADAVDAFDRFDMQQRTSYMAVEWDKDNPFASLTRTYKTFTEVSGKFIPTLSVSNQALRESGEWALKAGDNLSYATTKTYDAATAYQQMYGDLNHTSDGLQRQAQTAKDSAEAQLIAEAATTRLRDAENKLRDSINNVTGAFGGQTEMLTNMQLAQMAIDLATGKTTLAQFGQAEAAEALTKAYKDGAITFDDVVKTTTDLAKGNISVEDALKKAGKAGEQYAKELAIVKGAAERATSSLVPYKGALDRIPASKSTRIDAIVNGGDAVVAVGSAVAGIPATKGVAVNASVTGKQGVDDLSSAVNGIPANKRTDVTANTIDAQEMYELHGWINGIPTQKTATATVNTYGTGTLHDAVDTINQLKDMGLNVGVNTTVTVLGYNANSPVKRAGGASLAPASLAAGKYNGVNLNMPMTVNVKQGADAYALQAALRNVARAASLRASLG